MGNGMTERQNRCQCCGTLQTKDKSKSATYIFPFVYAYSFTRLEATGHFSNFLVPTTTFFIDLVLRLVEE